MASPHIQSALLPTERKDIVNRLTYAIKESGIEFDYIVVRGVSGLVIGPIIAHILDKKLVVSRKLIEDDCHATCLVEFPFDNAGTIGSYIIIDDLIASGATVDNIMNAMKEFLEPYGFDYTCVGVFLYKSNLDYTYIKNKFENVVPIFFTHPIDIKEMKEREEWAAQVKKSRELELVDIPY